MPRLSRSARCLLLLPFALSACAGDSVEILSPLSSGSPPQDRRDAANLGGGDAVGKDSASTDITAFLAGLSDEHKRLLAKFSRNPGMQSKAPLLADVVAAIIAGHDPKLLPSEVRRAAERHIRQEIATQDGRAYVVYRYQGRVIARGQARPASTAGGVSVASFSSRFAQSQSDRSQFSAMSLDPETDTIPVSEYEAWAQTFDIDIAASEALRADVAALRVNVVQTYDEWREETTNGIYDERYPAIPEMDPVSLWRLPLDCEQTRIPAAFTGETPCYMKSVVATGTAIGAMMGIDDLVGKAKQARDILRGTAQPVAGSMFLGGITRAAATRLLAYPAAAVLAAGAALVAYDALTTCREGASHPSLLPSEQHRRAVRRLAVARSREPFRSIARGGVERAAV